MSPNTTLGYNSVYWLSLGLCGCYLGEKLRIFECIEALKKAGTKGFIRTPSNRMQLKIDVINKSNNFGWN